MVASDEQLADRREIGVCVSDTVNGPEDVHDAHRVTRNGKGSFERVMERVASIGQRFGLISPSPLCVGSLR